MYCFYLFSEGGRFHYEGFGFGSFMFGNIASQIVGYYLIAACSSLWATAFENAAMGQYACSDFAVVLAGYRRAYDCRGLFHPGGKQRPVSTGCTDCTGFSRTVLSGISGTADPILPRPKCQTTFETKDTSLIGLRPAHTHPGVELFICILHHHAAYPHPVQRHVSCIWRLSLWFSRDRFA